MMRAGTSVALVLLMVLAGCSATVEDASGGDIEGVWLFDTYTRGGAVIDVEVDVNATSPPYMVIEGDQVSGDSGCNGFGGQIAYADGSLKAFDVFSEAAGCMPETLMGTEIAFHDMIWREGDIDVRVDGDRMTWRGGGETMTFLASDAPPPQPTIPPQTSVGPLDCGEDEVERVIVPAMGSGLEEIVPEGAQLTKGLDGVASVDQPDPEPVWVGFDASGDPVVVVWFDDVSPAAFSIFQCP